MTDCFKLPVTEGWQSFYLINICTKNVWLQWGWISWTSDFMRKMKQHLWEMYLDGEWTFLSYEHCQHMLKCKPVITTAIRHACRSTLMKGKSSTKLDVQPQHATRHSLLILLPDVLSVLHINQRLNIYHHYDELQLMATPVLILFQPYSLFKLKCSKMDALTCSHKYVKSTSCIWCSTWGRGVAKLCTAFSWMNKYTNLNLFFLDIF